jgi:ketosteroid isomerase-like protein
MGTTLSGNRSIDQRRRRAVLLALLSLVMPIRGRADETPVTPAKAEAEIRALEEARRDAIQAGDRAALERIYAPDFRGVTSGGLQVDQQQAVGGLLRAKGKAAAMDDVQVRVFGNAATATGRLRLADNGGTLRYIHVYARRDGVWQLVAGQSTDTRE